MNTVEVLPWAADDGLRKHSISLCTCRLKWRLVMNIAFTSFMATSTVLTL